MWKRQFVCVWDRCCACKTIQLIIVERSAAWAENTRVSVSGTHSLLFFLSHSCINTLTHTEKTRKSLSETGWACVGSEITARHTFPLSILQTVTAFVVCLCCTFEHCVIWDCLSEEPPGEISRGAAIWMNGLLRIELALPSLIVSKLQQPH